MAAYLAGLSLSIAQAAPIYLTAQADSAATVSQWAVQMSALPLVGAECACRTAYVDGVLVLACAS